MSAYNSQFFYIGLIISLCLFNTPTQAQNCYLTDEQIHEIRFHYDLDRYMVGGCIIGATFSTITGFMTLSGINLIAAVPYVATGCSLGFLVGASSMTLYKLFSSPENSSKQVLKDTWNKPKQ